jgi:dipeptidyl aminopeptidase/acylaminoacyl peptidase
MTTGTDSLTGNYPWDLSVVDVSSGESLNLARGVHQMIGFNYSWSPDSRYVAYLSGPGASHYIETRGAPGATLGIAAADGTSARMFKGELVKSVTDSERPFWSCDASRVVVLAEDGLWGANVSDVALRQLSKLEGYRPMRLLDGPGSAYTASSCAKNRRGGALHLLASSRSTGLDAWIRVDHVGRVRVSQLERPLSLQTAHFHGARELMEGGHAILTTVATPEAPTELVKFDLNGRARTVSAINSHFARYELGKSHFIQFDSPLGILNANVTLPSNYREGQRYPAVFDIYPDHGAVSKRTEFSPTEQMYATRGYVKVTVSSRVGEGTVARDLATAVLSAADEVIRLGWVDAERMAIQGCSGSGYATLATAIHTDRFKAAIAECGYYDVGGFWAQGWKIFAQDGSMQLRVYPWQDPARYVENSPFYYADRIKAPVLFIVGAKDAAFHEQTKQMYYAFQQIRHEAVMVVYNDEWHGVKKPINVIDYWGRVFAFLDAKLKQ